MGNDRRQASELNTAPFRTISNNPANPAGLFFFATGVDRSQTSALSVWDVRESRALLHASSLGAQRDENSARLPWRYDVASDELRIGAVEKIAHAEVGIERTLRPR